MGIDGIGKPGGVGLPPQVGSKPSGVAEGFSVDPAPAAGAAAEGGATEALSQLQRGDIGLEEYLDVQVEAATAHLQALPPEQLLFVRQTLRAELRQDPVLVELVRRATGANSADSKQ